MKDPEKSAQADESDVAFNPPGIDPISYREWHALLDGLYCGVVGAREHEYGKEKHYWRIGWIIGDMYSQFVRKTESNN